MTNTSARPRWFWPALFSLVLLLVAILSILSWRNANPPHRWFGMLLEPSPATVDFRLTAAGNRTVRLSDYRGHLVALYFGYTYCPDACPTTLSELARALKQMGEQAQEVQVIFVSVDPPRDTPERLAEYVVNFHPSFLGITGSPDEIAAAAAPLDIHYRAHEGSAASGYLVDHTASVTVLDRQGRQRLLLPFGASGDEIAADLQALLKLP